MAKSTLNAESALYIRDMIAELALLADANGMEVVAYLLRMAHEEARQRASEFSAKAGNIDA